MIKNNSNFKVVKGGLDCQDEAYLANKLTKEIEKSMDKICDYEERGDFEKALKEAYRINTKYPEIIQLYQIIWELETDYEKKANIYEQGKQNILSKTSIVESVFRKDESMWQLTYWYMCKLSDLGRYNDAIKTAKELIDISKGDISDEVLTQLVNLYLQIDNVKEAKKHIKNIDKNSLDFYILKMVMLFKEGKYKEAKEYVAKLDKRNEMFLQMLLGSDDEMFSMLNEINMEDMKKLLEEPDFVFEGSRQEAIQSIALNMLLLTSIKEMYLFLTYSLN